MEVLLRWSGEEMTSQEQVEMYLTRDTKATPRQSICGLETGLPTTLVLATGIDPLRIGDMSSISGSDSEDEEPDSDWVVENTEAAPLQKDRGVLEAESFRRLSNRVVFQNSQGQYLAVYRCVLQSKVRLGTDKWTLFNTK
nr:uncharacterized protein LOC115126564 isoform X2 [Oncorhynchus nerka]